MSDFRLIKKDELAKRWNVDPKTIENWIQDKYLEPCKLPGKKIMFNPLYIEQFEEHDLQPHSFMEFRRLERKVADLEEKLKKRDNFIAEIYSKAYLFTNIKE